MITLERSRTFQRTAYAFGKAYPKFRSLLVARLVLLKKNPFHPRLKTLQVVTRSYGVRWSSVIQNDLRIIWDFRGVKKTRIRLLAIGCDR